METNTNIISYLIKEKNFKQIEIAEKLGVANAQISKWKMGVKIPRRRETELMRLAKIWWPREDGRPPSEWAIIVKSKENEDNWFEFFEDCIFEYGNKLRDCMPPSNFITRSINPSDYKRSSVASELININDLIESILIVFNEAGIPIPEKAPVLQRYDPYIDPSAFQEFVKHYLYTYFELEDWCCSNLPLGYEYMEEFFNFLRRFTMFKLTIENIPSFFPYGSDPYELKEFQTYSGKEYYEIKQTIKNATMHDGMDFDPDIFKDLIEFSPFSGLEATNWDNANELLKKQLSDIDDLLNKESGSKEDENFDKYLSYGERKILEGIKNNEKLLKEVLKKL